MHYIVRVHMDHYNLFTDLTLFTHGLDFHDMKSEQLYNNIFNTNVESMVRYVEPNFK
jgi:hypothetical protein